MEKITQNLKVECIRRIEESTFKINVCTAKLTPGQIWYKPNIHCNSVGNLILHLCGNLTQYILSTLNHEPDQRERSKEFSTTLDITNEKLLFKFNAVITEVVFSINKLNTNQLENTYAVQCYQETGTSVLIHVTEHLSYHTGQIVYITKLITDENMNFYDDNALEKLANKS